MPLLHVVFESGNSVFKASQISLQNSWTIPEPGRALFLVYTKNYKNVIMSVAAQSSPVLYKGDNEPPKDTKPNPIDPGRLSLSLSLSFFFFLLSQIVSCLGSTAGMDGNDRTGVGGKSCAVFFPALFSHMASCYAFLLRLCRPLPWHPLFVLPLVPAAVQWLFCSRGKRGFHLYFRCIPLLLLHTATLPATPCATARITPLSLAVLRKLLPVSACCQSLESFSLTASSGIVYGK